MNSHRNFNELLKKLGADGVSHLNGSLEYHLEGTAELLRSWGASDAICIAGLFHAVYSTDGFPLELISLDLRDKISDLIGAESEELVYLYCACDRDVFYSQIGYDKQNLLPNRFTQEKVLIKNHQLCALCEITFANELQIADGNPAFINQYGEELRSLFERMHGLVSTGAFKKYKEVLCAA
ncbi:DUF6817 domain-containing protein [Chitinolyticbacter albus]|uniref:DUF6817 domain-containing protein n=1 Tax=Chitinolyticbacter albus TaxID=2961951 RepID=UPI00210F1F90|nr:hypothetical protein [Chitinolyticbacter albus]